MKKISIVILFLSAFDFLPAQQNFRFNIVSLPKGHPENSAIYVAGSFNGWNPADKRYMLLPDSLGYYYISADLNPVKGEYKFTRGGWDKAECHADGKPKENRFYNADAEINVDIEIAGWADQFTPARKKSTASDHVTIIDQAFPIPQLQRNRRVWIYLPPSYNTSGKQYPVLYMHDGQNVFEDSSSYSGEWGVDEYLDSVLLNETIVVAIDHGGDKRLNEYSPYDFSLKGDGKANTEFQGEGKRYVDFLVKTLKPYIDKNFRTRRGRKHTGIAGSSMGGLISMFAILDCPKVFGSAGVFSPAFWINPQIFDEIKRRGDKVKGQIYFYAGKEEGETMVPLMMKAFAEMNKVSKARMSMVIRTGGRHNEGRWRQEFPLFYEWMISRE